MRPPAGRPSSASASAAFGPAGRPSRGLLLSRRHLLGAGEGVQQALFGGGYRRAGVVQLVQVVVGGRVIQIDGRVDRRPVWAAVGPFEGRSARIEDKPDRHRPPETLSKGGLGVRPYLLAPTHQMLVGDGEDGRAVVDAEEAAAGETGPGSAGQTAQHTVAP